jgi:hypothetical protein
MSMLREICSELEYFHTPGFNFFFCDIAAIFNLLKPTGYGMLQQVE